MCFDSEMSCHSSWKSRGGGVGQIRFRGYLGLSGNLAGSTFLPLFVFYCIFVTIFWSFPLPPCVHLWVEVPHLLQQQDTLLRTWGKKDNLRLEYLVAKKFIVADAHITIKWVPSVSKYLRLKVHLNISRHAEMPINS